MRANSALILGRAAAGGAAGQEPVAVEVFGVVKAGDGLFCFDFGGEPGCRGAGVAFEDRDLGVFVLAGAGHDPERLVGDMPGQAPAELAGG